MKDNRLTNNFISFLLEPHEVKTNIEYPNMLFWSRNDETIAAHNQKYFWVHGLIWTKISEQFDLNPDETDLSIMNCVEQHYGLCGIRIVTGPLWLYIFDVITP